MGALRTILLIVAGVHAVSAGLSPVRLATNPGYRGRNETCPGRCSDLGPDPSNWFLYHKLEQLSSCPQTIFYDFTLIDPVDDPTSPHRIYACASYGADWANLPPNIIATTTNETPSAVQNATFQLGWSVGPQQSAVAVAELGVLSTQLRQYLDNGFAPTNRSTILFAQQGQTSVGLYIGKALRDRVVGNFTLASWVSQIQTMNLNNATFWAMQYCQPGRDADHTLGFIATGNKSFGFVQEALESWSKAGCLSFPETMNITETLPLTNSARSAINSSISQSPASISSSRSTVTLSTIAGLQRSWTSQLVARAQCSTVQVVSGDSCASLAQKCGITGAQFTAYNPGTNFCAELQPYQHVCCSAGTLPDFAPKPNSDGSCATYTVQSGDYCAAIAAEYSISVDQLQSFNDDTWAWNGCADLWVGTIICLSSGTPPMPAPLSNAVCGPQVPGTQAPPAGTNISTLNPCPLNACCDVWGQCGTTNDFCIADGTGAPGTAQPGTNGCISNCGTNLVRSAPPSQYRSIGFFEGFNLDRPCLWQDVSQIDTASYTHLLFAFGTLTSNFEVQTGDNRSSFEFSEFSRITGPARILSIGGWAFSTDPSTYSIFRDGVTATNRLTMATNIANFINEYDLDGVNIDWEYPGAPDIPGIPPGSPEDGQNYLEFLVILRNKMPNKEISIAAPASYWYLKGFLIEEMSPLLDYVIYMTYDLHGQWDSGNKWSQTGCPTGTCLRSDVNLTETVGALVMITKAGVPSNKVVVGVTSYGRSFGMQEAGCYTPECTFLGSAGNSAATPGPCTQTAGYLANAEINGILQDASRVNENYIDDTSNSNILVYDDTQWVAYMDSSVKAYRRSLYQQFSMGGTTDWAIDLQEYNDPPANVPGGWGSFLADASIDVDPFEEGNRTGNWTTLTCTNPGVQGVAYLTPQERWDVLDCANAWSDALNVWFTIDREQNQRFTESVWDTYHVNEEANCGDITSSSNCDNTFVCVDVQGAGSGPAAYIVINSLVIVNELFRNLLSAITSAAATAIDPSLNAFEDAFTPVPPPINNLWLEILLPFVGVGFTMIGATFFDGVFGSLPYFLDTLSSSDFAKDTTFAVLSAGASAAASVVAAEGMSGGWTVADQDSFSAYLGQVLEGWQMTTSETLARLFNGTESDVQSLSSLIVPGKLTEGKGGSVTTTASNETFSNLEASIARAFFAYAIPSAWTVTNIGAFVIDSGYTCGVVNPLAEYMSTATMEATSGCYNGSLYYLVYPEGSPTTCSDPVDCVDCEPAPQCRASYFSSPPGLNTLDGSMFGGITVDDLITGSVRTYVANGNQNSAPVADPTDPSTLQALQGQDVTTPGFIRLPVCTASMAYAAWDNANRVGNSTASPWPCVPLQGISQCNSFSYENATSNASPLVSDCQTIVTNIQGTTGDWEIQDPTERQLVSYGTCAFSAQADGVIGNVHFHVGSQDITTIITQLIADYSANGRVGGLGSMTCDGNIKGQPATWRLYAT